MRVRTLLLIVFFAAGSSLCAAEPPLRFAPVFPADIPYMPGKQYSESVAKLMEQREIRLRQLLAARAKILKTDPACRKLHEDALAAEKALNDHLRGRRTVLSLEQDLAVLEIQISKLELKKEDPGKKEEEKTVKYVPRGKTDLAPEMFAKPEKAAALLEKRDFLLQKLIEERQTFLRSDKKAQTIASEVIEKNKLLAVHLESKKEFKDAMKRLEYANNKLRNELKKENAAVPANPPPVK